jgi:predicted nucleic acid-binding protein
VKLVVDASVAIKWAVDEDQHALARALMRHDELVAPDFAMFEIANILWKKVRLGEVGREQASAALPGIRRVFARLVPASTLVDRALGLAIELKHPVYDCLYLAAAEAEAADVVTADKRFVAAVADTPYAARLLLLRDAV